MLTPSPRRARPGGGDANEGTDRVGTRRDRRAVPARFYALVLVVALLTMFGMVMVLSASAVTTMHAGRSGWTYFRRQALWVIVGAAAMAGSSKIPYQHTRRLVRPALALAFVLMVAVQMPGLGHVVNGARAWLYLGPIGFQPSEFMKIAVLLYAADLLSRRAHLLHHARSVLGPLLVIVGAAELLIVGQADLGSGLIVFAIAVVIAYLAGTALVPLAGVTAAATTVGAAVVLSTPFRRDRWLSFVHLAAHKQDTGFQVWQGLVGIASGGLFGVGLGAGKAKWGYLPEAHTDLVFAVLAEELGLVGVIVVCGLYLALAALGARVALEAADQYGQLLAGGITAWVLLQAILNIGGVLGMLPLTGITLPFLSFGGSSLIVMLTTTGILLNIAATPRVTPGRTRRARPVTPTT